MKQIVCEMCNSNDFVKQDGYFVCQHCGAKYTVEEAKKMMIEGTVDVQGTVKVDSSDDLKNLYQAAHNAREIADYASAIKHYELINAKDPNSWEAMFFLIALKTNSIKNSEIGLSAIRITNCLDKVFQLIKENVSVEKEQREAINDVFLQCFETAEWLLEASENFYKNITKGNGVMALTGVVGALSSASHTGEALVENQERHLNIATMICTCGNLIEKYCDMSHEFYKDKVVACWNKMLEIDAGYKSRHGSRVIDKEVAKSYEEKIKRYQPDYEEIKEQQRIESLPKSSTSPGWGKFITVMMVVYSLFPLIGALLSLSFLNSAKKGKATNINEGVAKTTLIINIIVTVIFAIWVIPMLMSM